MHSRIALKSVVIGENIENIAPGAFQNCINLENIEICSNNIDAFEYTPLFTPLNSQRAEGAAE